MICKHCHQHIKKFNFSMGEEWYHQPEGAAFQDNISRWCERTYAEPEAVLPETSEDQ